MKIFSLVFTFAVLAVVSSVSVACVRCEIWGSGFECMPGYQNGGYTCFIEMDPELQRETCWTSGSCDNYDLPWTGPPWIPRPLSSDSKASSSNECATGRGVETLNVGVLFSESIEAAPAEVRAVINALQPVPGVLSIPQNFEGKTKPISVVGIDGQRSDADDVIVNFSGEFVKEKSGIVLAEISFSGATSIDVALMELTPIDVAGHGLSDKESPSSNEEVTVYEGELISIK